jgi:ABC-2 type transport system permease protein
MIRYLRLYWACVKFSIMQATLFRVDFWLRIVMDLVFYGVHLGVFLVLFEHTPVLGDWTREQVLVFVAGSLIVDGLSMTLFSNNHWQLPVLINKGEFDFYLVKPVSTLFFVSLRNFALNSFVNLLMALGIWVWAVRQLPEPPSAGRLVLYGVLLLNGTLLSASLRVLMFLPVFWTQSGRGLEPLHHTLMRLTERPDGIFHGTFRALFTWVIPIFAMASFPARVLLDAEPTQTLATLAGVSLAFYALTLALWNRALRAYGSASS